MSYFCNAKDRIPDYLQSYVAYKFSCRACNACYVGKTDQNLGTRIKEHHHLGECNFYQYTLTLHSFPCAGELTLTNQDILIHIRTTVTDNMRIIGKSEN